MNGLAALIIGASVILLLVSTYAAGLAGCIAGEGSSFVSSLPVAHQTTDPRFRSVKGSTFVRSASKSGRAAHRHEEARIR